MASSRTPKRTPAKDVAAVEPMVRAVYDRLYGAAYWDRKHSETREGIVGFVVDTARAGSPRCIAHTERDGTPHYLDAADVLAALDQTNQEGN